jgi:hypothetical protein
MDAHASYPVLGRNAAFPTNLSDAKGFAKAYLADLKVSSKGDMKGKVLLRTQARFSTLKKNKNFRNWLDGSTAEPTRPRVMLIKTELEGSVRVSAGFFFNVVPRHDRTQNFHSQIARILFSTINTSGSYPDFEIEVYTLHGNGGKKARLYRMLTSSVSDVKTLTEKMAVVMPKPSTDISYIPQKVWDSLLASKQDDYLAMQRGFEMNHNSRLFTGLKNAKMLLAKTSAAGIRTGPAQGISIFSWLTRVTAGDGCIMFPKVFECPDGDMELWHHVSHDQEVRVWMSTALAEIARLSGMNPDTDCTRMEAMFKNPGKVWASLEQSKRVATLPAQRSVYMDFSPPTGVITFPNRQFVTAKRRNKGPGDVKLVFDLEAATTVSVLTPDTRSRASSRSRRKCKQGGTVDGGAPHQPNATSTENADDGRAAAAAFAKAAIQIADAAIAKYPPKVRTVHQGAYDTLADKFGNQVPVVAIDGKWVSLTVDTLLESRKKGPQMNFGLVARLAPTQQEVKSQSHSQSTARQTQQQSSIRAQATGSVSSGTAAGYVQSQATQINARTEGGSVFNLAPATVFGSLEDFPPLNARQDSQSANTRPLGDDDMDDLTEADGSADGSVASNGAKSTASASTAGQSVVTFAQVARRQAYVITETNDAVMHYTETVEEPTKDQGSSELTRLFTAKKKEAKKSSLQAAAMQGALERRAARATGNDRRAAQATGEAAVLTVDARQPIGPPARNSQGQLMFGGDNPTTAAIGETCSQDAGRQTLPDCPSTAATDERAELKRLGKAAFQRAKDESSKAAAVATAEARMHQMEQQMAQMQQLVAENARLNSVIQQLTVHNPMFGGPQAGAIVPSVFGQAGIQPAITLPREQLEEICQVPQVSNVMVEWSPSRVRRRSKKTPLEQEMPCRTPPRPPQGTPQTKKKPRVSAPPIDDNRFGPLSDDTEEMDAATEESLADVEERLDSLKIRNTHVQLDSTIKKYGASGQK